MSQPQDTMTGFITFGLKRTHDTLQSKHETDYSLRIRLVDAPLGVTVLLDVVLALAKGVPKFDCLIARTRDDLPVIGAEANGKDIGGVADKAAGGFAVVEIP